MVLAQHLQLKYDELQEQYNLLSEEIQFLRGKERTDDLSPRELFRLKKQVEEAEAERKAIEQQLEELEKSSGSEQLYRILLSLGYRQQIRLFRQLIEAESVAAYLIHGSPDYGQRWLLNRLAVQYVPYCMTGKVVKVGLSRRGRRIDVNTLWRELGGYMGLRGSQSSPSEIAERVYQCWQTQNVLLVIHDVNLLPEEGFYEIIHNFWLPLANKALDSESRISQFKLLMFLVDYEGQVGTWQVSFAERLDSTWKPYTPIRAPKITEFSDEELMEWMEDKYDALPPELTKAVDNTVQDILKNSNNGIPELTFEEICYRCGCNWYEESEKWLKL